MGEGFTRRVFLKASAIAGFVAAIPSYLWGFCLSKLQVRTVERGSIRFDPKTGLLHWLSEAKVEPYGLVVDGLVERPFTFSYGDLQGLPYVTQVSDFHCVEGWSVRDLSWGGFRFSEIVKRVKPKPAARFAVFHAIGTTESSLGGRDHYIESFFLDRLLDSKNQCLLALTLRGNPLTDQHGAPLRLVSPYDLGYKGEKYVRRMQFSDKEQPGWWTLANPIYPAEAPVPEDRLRQKPKAKW